MSLTAPKRDKEWAKRTVENEDYLPWADVAAAKKILGLPAGGLTDAEQEAYAKATDRLKAKKSHQP